MPSELAGFAIEMDKLERSDAGHAQLRPPDSRYGPQQSPHGSEQVHGEPFCVYTCHYSHHTDLSVVHYGCGMSPTKNLLRKY